MTELVYREISCQKAVNGNNFSQGNQDFNFSIGNPTAWIPSKSYFRVRASLRAIGRVGGAVVVPAQPTTADQLTFADDALACLYNNVYFRAGGQDVSSIVNYVPQAHALKTRVMKSGAWLNSVGKSAYMMEADFQKRVTQVASDNILYANGQGEYVGVSLLPSIPAYVSTVTQIGTTGIAALVAIGSSFLTSGLAIGDFVVFGGGRYQVSAVTDATNINIRTVDFFPVAAGANNFPIFGLKMRRRDGGQRNIVQGLFQPPIGIFQHSEPMGAGDYRFSMNPNTNYQRAAVQSTRLNGQSLVGLLTDNAGLVPSTDPESSAITNGDFALNILDVKLYVATIKVSIPKEISLLELMEMEITTKTITGTNMSFEFTVPSSTLALAFFSQSGNAGSNTFVSPTRFVQASGKNGTAILNNQNLVRSLQITYANTTKPSTRWASTFDNVLGATAGVGTANELQQRYNDDLQETRLIENHGGAESIGEWLQRGPYFYYSFSRDREDRATQVQVAVEFESIEEGANIMLAAFYSRVVEISVANGSVQEVRSLNR